MGARPPSSRDPLHVLPVETRPEGCKPTGSPVTPGCWGGGDSLRLQGNARSIPGNHSGRLNHLLSFVDRRAMVLSKFLILSRLSKAPKRSVKPSYCNISRTQKKKKKKSQYMLMRKIFQRKNSQKKKKKNVHKQSKA